jgi:hypothetical protein
MADLGPIELMLTALPDTERRVLSGVFKYLLKDIRFGRAEANSPSTNFGGGFFSVTTPAVAGTEFTVAHSFGRVPYLCIPVLPLDSVGARIVPLEVSRAADAVRIYLKSTIADAPVLLYVEG